MNRTVQQWFDEPDFAKLPTVDKERLIGRYFDQDLVDERFQELPENERAAIRSEFVDANMAPNRPKPPERGVLADVGVSIARGAIGVAEMGARGLAAVDLLGGEESPMAAEVARDIAGYREDVLPVSRQARTDPVRKAWTGGVESAVTSLGVAAPTVAIGAMTGGASGAAIGYIMGAPLFGLAQYQQSYDEYVKKGVPKAEAQHVALLMGASEAGFEFFTDALEIATVGMGGVLTKPAKAAAKDGIKRLISSSWSEAAKRGLAVTGTEMAGELANVGTQAEIEHAYRVGDERFWGAVKENFGQIGVASLIFGAVGGGIHKLRTGQVRDALLDPDAAADDRFSAVSEVANELARTDKGLSERWREGALQAVLQGKAISEEIEEADSSELIADSKKPAAPMGGPGEDVTAQAKAPERKKTDIRKLLTGRETPVRQPSIAPVEEVGKAEAPPRAETAPAAATAPPEAAVPAATEAAAALEAQGEAIAGEAIQPGALPEVVAASPRPDAAAMLTGRPREANPESRLEAAPTETTAKEPWEMTRDEYVADTKANNRSYKASQKARERNIEYQKNADKYIDSLHRNHVIRAIEQGKPVPPEVLSEYPDLQPKTKTDAAATLTGRPKQPIHESYISEKEQAAVARMEEKTGGWYIDADDKPRWADAPVTVEKVSGWRGPYSKQEITELLGKDAMEGGSGKAEGGKESRLEAAPTRAAAVKTEAPPAEESWAVSSVRAEDVLNKDGKPYRNANAAKFARRGKKLEGSHDVAAVEGGFALRPKGEGHPVDDAVAATPSAAAISGEVGPAFAKAPARQGRKAEAVPAPETKPTAAATLTGKPAARPEAETKSVETVPAGAPLDKIQVEIRAYSESGAAMMVRERADTALAENSEQLAAARRVLDCLNI